MRVATLNAEGLQHLSEGMDILYELRNEKKYFEFIKGIMEMMEWFKEDEKFYSVLVVLRDETKDMWKAEMKRK